jgi:hypothetical protein
VVHHDGSQALIASGTILWHLALGAFLWVIWRLSARLGRAMRDDVGPIALFPVAGALALVAGIAFGLSPLFAAARWVAVGADVGAAATGWYAAWHSWGWLVSELKRSSSGG